MVPAPQPEMRPPVGLACGRCAPLSRVSGIQDLKNINRRVKYLTKLLDELRFFARRQQSYFSVLCKDSATIMSRSLLSLYFPD